jgi:hypothetical protein
MTPQQKKTTTESIELYKQTLQGKNFSPHSLKAYMGDIEQFLGVKLAQQNGSYSAQLGFFFLFLQ